MAKDHGADALNQIRSLFVGGVTGDVTDGDLLRRFNARDGQASELAFAVLVERHGPMVLRVARSILLDPHDADDAFQATFLVLARKADSLRPVLSLGPWLHGVASRVASCLRSGGIRRRNKERRAAEGKPRSIIPHEARDLGPALDEEIDRLPERYRAAVVLCLVEGLTQEQAANALGWPPGTVRSRLARGRLRLQERLERRGLAPSAVLLGARTASDLVPAALIESTTRAAMQLLSGPLPAGTVPASVVELTIQVSRSLTMSRVKVAFLLAVVTCVGAVGLQAFARQKGDSPSAGAKPQSSAKGAPAAEGEPVQVSPLPWRWSYHSVRLIQESQIPDKANEEAMNGWELVQVIPVLNGVGASYSMQYTLLFRRAVDTKSGLAADTERPRGLDASAKP